MEAVKILSADLLDIIFEGRNKSYGAYELRKNYNKTLRNALFISSFFVSVIMFWLALGNKVNIIETKPWIITDPTLGQVFPDEPAVNKVVPPASTHLSQPNTNRIRIEKEKEPFPIETIPDLPGDPSGTSNGSDPAGQTTGQGPQGNPTIASGGTTPIENNLTFFKPDEVKATFPGGETAWVRYLRDNLDAQTPIDYGALPGTYQVIIRFSVSPDGRISDVYAETKHGFGMEAEAIKIIRKGPKWVPARQNGTHVNSNCSQTITFIVPEP